MVSIYSIWKDSAGLKKNLIIKVEYEAGTDKIKFINTEANAYLL